MLKQNTLPYVFILIVISFCTILFSTYFIAFFLAGVVFKIFSISLRKGYNYILIFTIITFLVIENIQGLKPFVLTGISLFVYYLIIPRLKHLLSSAIISSVIYMISFYLLFYLVVQIQSPFELELLIIFAINFLIDILIVGFIL